MARSGAVWGNIVLAVTVLAVASCEGIALSCTTEARAGIQVAVRDAATGVPAAGGARGVVQDGAFVDSLRSDSIAYMWAAHERPGVYAVIITKNGYREWRRVGVAVTSGRCHVNTTELLAMLERLE